MLNTVLLTGGYFDGSGNPLTGTVAFVPSVPLTDVTNSVVVLQSPISVAVNSGGQFSVALYATDSSNLAPSGWTWQITENVAGVTPSTWNFFLAHANGSTQDLSTLTPVAEVTPVSAYLPVSGGSMTGAVTLGGSPPAKLPSGTSGYVLTSDSSGDITLQPAAGAGAVSSVFGRTGAITAQSGDYAVSEVTGAAPLASPVLTGTPAAPTAAVLTDSTQLATTAYTDSAVAVEKTRALAAEAAAQSTAEAASVPAATMTTPGDSLYGGASGAATRLPGNTSTTKKFWTQTGTGSASQAPALGTIVISDLPIDGSGPGGVTTSGLGLALLGVPAGWVTSGSAYASSAGQVYFTLATAYKSLTISYLGILLTRAAVTAGGDANQLALFSEAGSLLAQTGDMTTEFEASAPSWAEGVIANPGGITSYTLTEGSNYYLAVSTNFTGTTPEFGSIGFFLAVPALNGHYMSGYLSGQTTMPASVTPSSLSKDSTCLCIYAR